MPLRFQQNWQVLTGQLVELRINFSVVRTGVVDSVTPDGQILWIAADGPLPRMMFERVHGYHVWAG